MKKTPTQRLNEVRATADRTPERAVDAMLTCSPFCDLPPVPPVAKGLTLAETFAAETLVAAMLAEPAASAPAEGRDTIKDGRPGFHSEFRAGPGLPRLEYQYRGRPSWKASGEGLKVVRMDLQHDGSLYVVANEMVQQGDGLLRTGKEVYFEVPQGVVEFIAACWAGKVGIK